MQVLDLHSWEVSAQEARRIQREFAHRVQLCPLPSAIRLVAGADVSYHVGSDRVYAGVVVLQFPKLSVVEETTTAGTVSFPYIPGLLSFREAPVLLQAFRKVTQQPDVVLFDGQGIAHPCGMGIASHVGLFLDRPTVGCAKSWLTGRYDPAALQEHAGAFTRMFAKDGTCIGAVVRTKTKIKPVFVSPGCQADVETAVKLVLNCCRGYKLPEPTRLAHQLVNRARKKIED